jgi:hypothetical protein
VRTERIRDYNSRFVSQELEQSTVIRSTQGPKAVVIKSVAIPDRIPDGRIEEPVTDGIVGCDRAIDQIVEILFKHTVKRGCNWETLSRKPNLNFIRNQICFVNSNLLDPEVLKFP